MNLLALRTENYFFNAKSLNLTASKNINFYFQIRMFWLSQQNTPTLDTVYLIIINSFLMILKLSLNSADAKKTNIDVTNQWPAENKKHCYTSEALKS